MPKQVDTSVARKPGRPTGGPTFPRDPLSKVLKLATSIKENNAGRPYDRILLAKSLDYSPNSSGFRQLITSAGRYGVTEGGYMADKISLTAVGGAIVSPTRDGERERATLQALLTPSVFKRVLEHYDKNSLPRDELFKNALEKSFDVLPEDVGPCYDVLMRNLEDFGLVEAVKGTQYLRLARLAETSGVPAPAEEPTQELAQRAPGALPEEMRPGVTPETPTPPKPRKVFIAHGKNKRPLEQLKSILSQFRIPYEVAIDEPHKGRPISEKVAESMEDCTSGIFIFTADEETEDSSGNKIQRPSDNVVFELGAATVRFGDRIVIFREEGVSFGSDFTEYGHITFKHDRLDEKAFELMKELVGLGFLQITPA